MDLLDQSQDKQLARLFMVERSPVSSCLVGISFPLFQPQQISSLDQHVSLVRGRERERLTTGQIHIVVPNRSGQESG